MVPNLGRTGSSMIAEPVNSPKQELGTNNPSLEYEVFIFEKGVFNLTAFFSPTLNYQKDEGLLYAFSIDGGEPVIMNLHKDAIEADWTYPDWWNNAVTENIMRQTVLEKELNPGLHTIKFIMIDPGLVFQKIVLTKNDVEATSYLGPPESKNLMH